MATSSEMSAAVSVSPLGLVSYQERAVVSRTLLKRAGGTITLFVLEGEGEITIAGTPLSVSAGELMLMPANQPHAVTARTRFKMLLTMIRSV
jgi:quercetin dioxygenase-like cupin family protein